MTSYDSLAPVYDFLVPDELVTPEVRLAQAAGTGECAGCKPWVVTFLMSHGSHGEDR
jgi:hypothetical protein